MVGVKIDSSASSFMHCRDYDFNYEPKVNGLYSRDNLPEIKDWAYVINLLEKQSKETHWIYLFIDRNTFRKWLDSSGNVKENQRQINHVFRIKSNDIIIYRLYYVIFLEYLISGKSLLDYTNLLGFSDYKKNDKYFSTLKVL